MIQLETVKYGILKKAKDNQKSSKGKCTYYMQVSFLFNNIIYTKTLFWEDMGKMLFVL